MSKDDSSLHKIKRTRNRTLPVKDIAYLIERRNREFVNHAVGVIEQEISYHTRNGVIQITAVLLWMSITAAGIYYMYKSGMALSNIPLSIPTAMVGLYTYTSYLHFQGHLTQQRLWSETLQAVDFQTNNAFESFLDRVPRDLKSTQAYKNIRRKHFELSCNIGVIHRLVL